MFDVETGRTTLSAGAADATLDNVSVSGRGTIEVGLSGAATLTLTDGANTNEVAVTIGRDSTLDLDGSAINGGPLTVSGMLDSTGSSFITGASIVNPGNIEVTSGTLTIDPTPVTNTGTILVTDDSTLVLNGETVTNSITDPHTLAVINGTIQVDATDATHVSTLDLESSTIDGGIVKISGVLESTGTSFIDKATINNSGTIDVTGGTLTIDAASSLTNTRTLEADGGTLFIKGDVSGAGAATITDGGTLDLGGADAQTVTFVGAGTLKLEDLANFTGTISGLATGDVIDLAGTVVTAAYFDGSTLLVNGQPTSFQISSVPAGDTVAFKTDGSGGTDLKVLPQVLAVGSPSPVTGIEGAAIQLDFSDTVTGASLSRFVISGIPDGAVVSDGTPGHSYLSGSADGSVDVASWNLSSLTITPANDANFTLSAIVTAVDSSGFDYTLPATEVVTVNPTAPTLTWAAQVSGIETQVALGNLAETITGASGDDNGPNTLTISGAPKGVVLSDGHGHSATSDGQTAIDISAWNLSCLTADTSKASVPDGNFTLTATAIEKDADGNVSATTTATEQVTINPKAPTLTWAAQVSGTETEIALGSLAETITGASGDNNSPNTLTISGAPRGVVLSDGVHTATSDGHAAINISAWNLSCLTANTSGASVPDGNFTLTATATEKDADSNVSTATTATEQVTVNPTAPTLTWAAQVSGTETQVALGSLTDTITGHTGDHNSANTLTISGAPQGVVLSDGVHTATSDGKNAIDISAWNLSCLTANTSKASVPDGNFTLTATATEKDADGNVSASTTATEQVRVNPDAPTVSPVAESGIEGTPIALDLGTKVNGLSGDGNSLASLVVSAIPVGATLHDDQGHTFTATAGSGNQPVDVHSWDLTALSITPANDTNFTLSVAATEKDADGDLSATTTNTETVTVAPDAPTVTWGTGTASGTEGSAIALQTIGYIIKSEAGDVPGTNKLQSLVISSIPVGAVLADDRGHTFTATVGSGNQQVDVHSWNSSHLTITPTNDTNFTLSVTATEQDRDSPAQTSTATVTEAVTVNPTITLGGLDGNHNAAQGTQVTATVNDPNAGSDLIYTWTVGGKTVSGDTGNTYTPTEADEGKTLSVSVSFHDTNGNSKTGSASGGTVQEIATGDLVATLSSTAAQQGVMIRVTGVTDGGAAVSTGLSYAWQESSNNGSSWVTVGSHSSFTPGESDEGKLLQLVVTYTDASGSESSTYSLGMPNDLVATLDSTTAQQGLAIHVTGVADGGTAVSDGVSYAWQVFSGGHWTTVGTNSSFTPTAADAGEQLQVVVTYVDSGEHESTTASLGTVAAAKEWVDGSDHWQTGHWTPSGAPTSTDNALVDVSGTYTVEIDHAAAAHSLVLNDTGATVEIIGGDTLTLGGNLTIEAGKLHINSGATLIDNAASATITGTFTDNGTVESAAGTLEIASDATSGEGKFTIDAGDSLQFDHADALDVAFAGSGELILKDPAHFSGIISDSGGSMTAADVVDLSGFDTNASVSYSGNKSGGTVTVSEANHATAHLQVGANSTNWSNPVSDGHGGILIHDPPDDAGGQPAGDAVTQDPGAAPSQSIVATAPNQTLTGAAVSDNFVFNFASVGRDTVTNFHSATDTLHFASPIFANALAALNATHDDGLGNTVVALDGHDTVTLSGVLKAQLHATDFHVV